MHWEVICRYSILVAARDTNITPARAHFIPRIFLSIQQRDRQEKKSLFRSVYMNTVFPLLKLISLPQLVVASPEVEEVNANIIYAG
jgi:hypothetical protein